MNKYINVLHSNYKKCFDYNYKNLETFKLKKKKKLVSFKISLMILKTLPKSYPWFAFKKTYFYFRLGIYLL